MTQPLIFKVPMILKLDLQFFGGEENPNGDNPQQQEPEQQQQEKTFTQTDVDTIIATESQKALETFLKENGIEDFETAKDGMAKFKDWQDSQKTEQQKQAAALEAAQKELATEKADKATLAAQLAALKAGTNAESLDDVITLAQPRVSEKVTIEQAIAQVLEKYPQFKGQQEQEKPTPPQYSPGGGNPPGNTEMTREQFAKLSYAKRVEYQTQFPEQFKKIFG